MTAYNFTPEVTKIPFPDAIGLGTITGNMDMSGHFITPYYPWPMFIFFVVGMIAIIVVYSYSELVWCKEVKKDAKKN